MTGIIEVNNINDAFATLSGATNGTLPAVANPSSTPYGLDELLATTEADTDTMFGTTKGMLAADVLGPFAPLGVLAIAVVALVLALKSSTFVLTLLVPLVGIVRRIVSLILDFLPF